MLDIVLAEESPIATVDFWCFTECFLVTLQRGFDVCIICGISIEHPILSDQAVGALRNVDFMAEFHRLEDLASFDQIRVSFEYRKDLLFVRHLLLIKDSSPCLINDAIPKATVMVDLLSDGLDRDFGHQVNATDSLSLLEHLARISDHLLRGVDEFAIFRDQLVAPLLGRHPLDLLHPASGTASAIGESRHSLGKQFVEISKQPSNDSDGIPQQGTIRWVMNVRFHYGRIHAQFLAVFESDLNGRLDDQIIDQLERRRREPVKDYASYCTSYAICGRSFYPRSIASRLPLVLERPVGSRGLDEIRMVIVPVSA